MPGFRSNNNSDCVYASNFDFSGSNQPTNTMLLNGQLIIGSTALNVGGTHCNIGKITSPLGTLNIGYSSPNITIDLVGGTPAIEIIHGDTGFISGNDVTIFANNATNNSGQTVKFVNSGIVSTLNVTDALHNTMIGLSCGKLSQTYSSCTAVGELAGNALTSATGCTFLGQQAGTVVTTGSLNTFIGSVCGTVVTTGNNNVAVGQGSLNHLISGINNYVFGTGSGSAYSGSESSNILVGNSGTISDNNTIRIGNQGTGTGLQNACYIAGINGNTVSNTLMVTIDSSTGQLGTQAVPTSPSLPLSLANGGTNANLTASNGGIFYSTATAAGILAGTATAGKVLQSGASTTPIWSSSTYPSSAGTSGNFLVSDGTNWVSTPLFQLQTKTLVLTSAQVKNLHGTPISFIPAPGAGKINIILGAASKLTFGTNVFVAGASQVISLTYGTGTNAIGTVMNNGCIVASSSSYNIPSQASVSNTTALGLENLVINAYNSTATEISGNAANDNTITITAFYYTLSI